MKYFQLTKGMLIKVNAMTLIQFNSTGSNRIEKGKVVYFLHLFEGTWEKEQCDLVCGVLLDDWVMLVYVDVLLTCGKYSFNSLGSWSYSKEWVWILGTQSIYSFIHSFIHS